VPKLIPPTATVHASYLRAMEEHIAEGRGLPGDGTNVGQYIRQYGKVWSELPEFQRFIDGLRAQELADTPRPANYVPTTSLWWVDGDEYLGRLGIRHRLAPGRMGERNGHIGYDVRPSARRKGHATGMLAASLPIAAAIGLPRVLVTCDDTNEASRRTIERNGGVLHDRMDEKLRYWLPTAS
jgi:predicted acetyltransferase